MSGNRIADEADISSAVSSCGHADSLPYVHKVGVPPKQNLLNEFKFTLKETFFHDDPLRSFKDQPKARKLLLGIQAIFPILDWGRRYDLSMFRADLIAGLTIASLCIPQVFYALETHWVAARLKSLVLIHNMSHLHHVGHCIFKTCQLGSTIWAV